MKALIVRFSAIGDCVMAVPVAEAIRRRYPEADLTWAIEPRCAPVVDTERLVSRLALFPRDAWESRRWSPTTWFDQIRTYLSMRKQAFDIGIDLHGHSKTALCLRLAAPRQRIAVSAKDKLAKKLNPVLGIPLDGIHTVERHMLALSKLRDFPTDPHWVMPALQEERVRIAKLLPMSRPLATIAVSAGQRPKTYPLETWAKVGRQLQVLGWNVAYLGGPGDPPGPLPSATDLVGKLSLTDTMAAVTLSDVHLAADTGTGHMAAAYGVPVVSVFGHTNPITFRPYTDRGTVLVGTTRPADVHPEEIVDAAIKLLGAVV